MAVSTLSINPTRGLRAVGSRLAAATPEPGTLLAFLLYVGLACSVTWPIPLHPGTRVYGPIGRRSHRLDGLPPLTGGGSDAAVSPGDSPCVQCARRPLHTVGIELLDAAEQHPALARLDGVRVGRNACLLADFHVRAVGTVDVPVRALAHRQLVRRADHGIRIRILAVHVHRVESACGRRVRNRSSRLADARPDRTPVGAQRGDRCRSGHPRAHVGPILHPHRRRHLGVAHARGACDRSYARRICRRGFAPMLWWP